MNSFLFVNGNHVLDDAVPIIFFLVKICGFWFNLDLIIKIKKEIFIIEIWLPDSVALLN